MMRARSVVVAAMLAGLVLAGCGGPQDPKPLEEQENAQDNGPDDTGDEQGEDSGDDGGSSDDGEGTPSDDDNGDGQRIEQQEDDWKPVDAATEAEIKKAALRFTKEYHRMLASGDSASVEKLYTDECQQCRREVTEIQEVYKRGGRFEGGEVINPQVTVRGSDDTSRVEVLLAGKSAAYKAVDSSGKVLESGSAKQDNQKFWFREVGGAWKLVWWV